jgi:hypothetical protein
MFKSKLIHPRIVSWLLLSIMLTVTFLGVYESAAMDSHVPAARDQVSCCDISASHQAPCSPLEQHSDYDGCDTCDDCGCHAPLTAPPFQLSYNPIVSDHGSHDPFQFLPEVYLSKFIPPENQA